MKMLPGQLAELRAKQYAAYHSDVPGAWFDNVTRLLNEDSFDTAEGVISINLANGEPVVYDVRGNAIELTKQINAERIGDDGTVVKEKVDVFDGYVTSKHRGWNPELLEHLVPGCVPCVGELQGARIGAGVMVVVGRGGSAKTPFAYALAEELGGKDGYEAIRLGEPLSGYNTDLQEATGEIVRAVLTERIIVIDSIKDVLGNAGGNATSSGLSRGAFQFISDLGTIATSRGCLIIIPVNPSSSDPRIEDLMIEVSKSNATMVAVGNTTEWNIISRTGEGLKRVNITVPTGFDEDSLMMRIGKSASTSKEKSKVRLIATDISNSDFETILSRIATR